MLTIITNKNKNRLIVFLTIALVITSFLFYRHYSTQQKQYERQYQTFINHFYFSVKDSLSAIERIIEFHHLPSVKDNLENDLSRLYEQMQKTDYILQYGSIFIDNDIYYNRFFQTTNFMINGLHSTTNNRDPVIIPPFAEDGTIDEVELAVLQWIKDDLQHITEGLYSEETRQENPNISLHQFNEIVRSIAAKDYYDIANKYRYEEKKLTSE